MTLTKLCIFILKIWQKKPDQWICLIENKIIQILHLILMMIRAHLTNQIQVTILTKVVVTLNQGKKNHYQPWKALKYNQRLSQKWVAFHNLMLKKINEKLSVLTHLLIKYNLILIKIRRAKQIEKHNKLLVLLII